MGLIDKFKNMFTEEVDEDDVVVEKKQPLSRTNIQSNKIQSVKINETHEDSYKSAESVQVVKPSTTPTRVTPKFDDEINFQKVSEPKIISKSVETNYFTKVEEKPVMKREEKFVFPVYFDDKDFEKIEEKKPKVEPKKQPEKKENLYGTKIEKKEPAKVFKPTPIISPIYGVLDKNYNKDDISSKKVVHTEYRNPNKPLTIDEVRQKAYGSLESDIENSLIAKSSIFMEPDNNVIEKEESKNNLLTDLVDENEYSSVDDFLNSPIEEYKAKHTTDTKLDDDFDLDDTLNNLEKSVSEMNDNNLKKTTDKSNSLDDVLNSDDNVLEDYIMNNNANNEETKDDEEDLTQSDLFNLIDSMYEKGDE